MNSVRDAIGEFIDAIEAVGDPAVSTTPGKVAKFLIEVACGFPVAAAIVACTTAPDPRDTPRTSIIVWPPPLVVEHDAPVAIRITAGERVTIVPSLRNTATSPVAITHGGSLFVLQMTRTTTPDSVRPHSFPPHQVWGSPGVLEFPHPAAVYISILYVKTLQPGERYAPALLYQRSEYLVPFDSVGDYRVRVCAEFDRVRLCDRREITVEVVPRQ